MRVAVECLVLLCALSEKAEARERVITLTELETLKRSQNYPTRQQTASTVSTHGSFSKALKIPPLVSQNFSSTIPAGSKHPSSVQTSLTLSTNTESLSLESAFWWQRFPLTGLFFVKPIYPYLPHAFSLWELAPSLGKGITTTFIDTGVFGWTLTAKECSFTHHPDLEISGNFLHEPHSTCPFPNRSIDPFENLVSFIASRTAEKDHEKIRRLLPFWIEEFVFKKTTTQLDAYLQTHGSPDLFIHSHYYEEKIKKLSAEGKRVKNTLLHKEQGLGQFTPVILASGHKAILEYMPLPVYHQSSSPLFSYPFIDHATHTSSMVGSRFAGTFFRTHPHAQPLSFEKCLMIEKGLCGLAPKSQIRVIKALQEGLDTTHVDHISAALRQASLYESDIINLSLRLEESNSLIDKRFARFEEQCAQFPFLCCAAGNEGTHKPGILGYPARFKSVFFSVGSFGCSYQTTTGTYSCHLSPFSQYEPGKGPHFVAPGENILGCSSVSTKGDPLYAIHTGTSYATAYLSGCLTLILGEFKNDFSSQEIMTVCRHSCFRLHATIEWKRNVTYGVLDTRTALFTLHVLKKLKKAYKHKDFNEQFDHLMKIISEELLALPTMYARKHGIPASFNDAFIDYYNKARTLTLPPNYQEELDVSLEEALKRVTNRIIAKNLFPSGQ